MVPTGEQICEKQLFNLADRIEKVKVNEEEIAKYLPNISRKLGWLTEQDLIKRIVSLEFNRLIDYYRDTPDLDIPDENTRKPKEGNFAKEGRNGRKKTFAQPKPDSNVYISTWERLTDFSRPTSSKWSTPSYRGV